MRLTLMEECEHCGMIEERVFNDSWTGKALCLACLIPIAQSLTNSPQSEGDNLNALLRERVEV